jgi:hypothetical protein
MSTEPGPASTPTLADLAHQVHELDYMVRETAIGTEDEIDGIKTAATRHEQTLADLEQTLADLEETVADLSPPDDTSPDTAKPVAWLGYATRKDWQALAEWVEWLISTYELQPSRTVLPCWPAHPGVVEELAALHQAWLEAAAKGHSQTPNDSMIFWHDRWFHPCTLRLREVSQYRLCVDGHKPVLAARPADTELLAKALAEAPEDPAEDPAGGE